MKIQIFQKKNVADLYQLRQSSKSTSEIFYFAQLSISSWFKIIRLQCSVIVPHQFNPSTFGEPYQHLFVKPL